MSGKARRAQRAQRWFALRLETLESRALLSGDLPSGVSSTPIDPATSLMVGFQANATAAATQAALSAVGGWIAERFPDGSDVVEFPSSVDSSAALARLKADPAVAYAELGRHDPGRGRHPERPGLPARVGAEQREQRRYRRPPGLVDLDG